MAAAEQLITANLDIWSSTIKAKSAAGRGKSNKLELYGIKKLRELILELAVRGLLVPQDPNDEPASELLKRIAAEKAELVKDKKIKKQKALPAIEEDEAPFSLPKAWEWVRLGGIQEFTNGYAFKSADLHDGPGIGIVKIGDVYRDKGIAEDKMQFVTEVTAGEAGDKYQILPGDLVITMTGDVKLGFNTSEKTYLLNQRVGKIRCFLVDPKYVYLRLVTVAEQKIEEASGGVIPNVSTTEINTTLISLPPLAEQARIVAKVDELMALCDQLEQQQEASITAHQTLVQTLLNALTTASERDDFSAAWARIADHFDTLFTTEWSIDQLKQTILQLAVMGKLVPQDPNDEPGSELLKKIAAEKVQLVKDGKIKKQKVLPAIEDDDQPCELPEGWEWCRLNEMITLMDAGWSPACPPEPSPSDDVWGVLKTTAVQTLEYQQNENKVLAGGKEPRPQYEVKRGDILITRAGPKNRVAISCLVENTRPKLMISDKIIRFHLVEIGLSERYVSLCLNAGATAAYLESAKSGMAESQMNISQDKLKMAPIPLAPLNEQRKIIETIDRLIELCDTLKTRLNIAQTTQLQLADSMAEKVVI